MNLKRDKIVKDMSKFEKMNLPFGVAVTNVDEEEFDGIIRAKVTLVVTDPEWPKDLPRLQGTVEVVMDTEKFHEEDLPEDVIGRKFKALLFKFAAIGLVNELKKSNERKRVDEVRQKILKAITEEILEADEK